MSRCLRDPAHGMTVISIQSQVAFGHVGNSAAVFPMQMHGIDVIAVPTTLLSNRPGYPSIRGRVLDAQLVADLLRGLEHVHHVVLDRLTQGHKQSPGFVHATMLHESKQSENPANPSLVCETLNPRVSHRAPPE
jgi:pyridoxine kinase